VQELPAINFGPTGTQKSAENIAEKALQIGHHFNPGKGSVLYAAPDCWTPSGAADPKVTIDLKFLQKSGLAQYQKCARVILTPASLVVTLTCPGTAGAIIRYSIDGSYPTLTYTAPLTVPSGTLVRAAAHTVDLQQSDLTELYVT
jgi:hypothetical protein